MEQAEREWTREGRKRAAEELRQQNEQEARLSQGKPLGTEAAETARKTREKEERSVRKEQEARLSQVKSLGSEAATPPGWLCQCSAGSGDRHSEEYERPPGQKWRSSWTSQENSLYTGESPASPGSAPTPSTPKKVASVNKEQEPVAGDWGDIGNWAEEMNRESLEEDVEHTAGAPTIDSQAFTKEGLSH